MKWAERADIKAIINELDSRATYRSNLQYSIIQRMKESPEWEKFAAAYDDAQRHGLVFNTQGFDKDLCASFRELQSIRSNAARIRMSVAELQTLIAPMQFMPEEVLSLVFQLATCDEHTIIQQMPGEPIKALDVMPTPLIIASVSRRWRHIAMKTPALWTNVLITLSRPKCWPRLAMQKSATRRIDITIDCRASSCPPTWALDSFVNELLPHVDRWCSFAVVADHCNVLANIGSRLAYLKSSELEDMRFTLTGRGTASDQHITIPSLFSAGAPKLCSVRVDSVALKWNSPILSDLDTLDLRWLWSDTKLTYEQFRYLMMTSPTLTTLVLRGFYVQLSPATNYRPIHAPSLRHLEISGDSVCAMLSLLVTPSLTSLLLANVDESEFRVLGEFFESSSQKCRYPSLRSLTLLNVKTSKPTEGFLEVMSNITDLTIINAGSEDFLAVLRARQIPVRAPRPSQPAPSTSLTPPSMSPMDISLDDELPPMSSSASSAASLALLTAPPTPPEPTEPVPLVAVPPAFPRLRNLTLLHDVDATTLLDMVRNRKDHGFSLESLIVHAGSLSKEHREMLQRFLRVDGIYYRTVDQ